jgi:hypothetical protein
LLNKEFYETNKAKGVFILAIEADSFLSRNRTRFVSVINIGSLALPLDVRGKMPYQILFLKEVIMILTEIEKMSTIERLQAMEKLWDSLCNEEEIESPEWHKDILQERKKKIEKGGAEYVSLEDLKGNRKG